MKDKSSTNNRILKFSVIILKFIKIISSFVKINSVSAKVDCNLQQKNLNPKLKPRKIPFTSRKGPL